MTTLSIFDEHPEDSTKSNEQTRPMFDSQRSEIRSLFGQLQLVTAREQFALIDELIGVRLTSAPELSAADAQRLIPRLRGRVATRGRSLTGDSWADREEDTWIDKL